MKRFPFIMALVILCFVSTNFSQQPTAEKLVKVKGSVKNQDKVPLAGLNLFFERKESTKTFVTDENGFFIAEIAVGKYKITPNSAISKNFTAFIEVFDNNMNPTDFELIIEFEKFCCNPMSNGNITEVVKYVAPPYPAAARAVRAFGEVVVAVKIDKEGKVISAQAEFGHPLLRAASEVAARQWLFSGDENKVEREGKIVFAFVLFAKKGAIIFIKPNRLEIFPEPFTISD